MFTADDAVAWAQKGEKAVGLDYVSCSPYRVPIARLAAAQAQLQKPTSA